MVLVKVYFFLKIFVICCIGERFEVSVFFVVCDEVGGLVEGFVVVVIFVRFFFYIKRCNGFC